MKNILVATMIITGAFASINTVSANDDLKSETSNWVLDSYNAGSR